MTVTFLALGISLVPFSCLLTDGAAHFLRPAFGTETVLPFGFYNRTVFRVKGQKIVFVCCDVVDTIEVSYRIRYNLMQDFFRYLLHMGFDTAYYHDMRDSIDNATWWAKYMGQPYVREGLLFPPDELRYYNGVLPDGEPDQIVATCDVAWGGGDSLSMPIAYVYGEDVYIHDVVFNRGDKEVTRPEVVGKLKRHKPHMVRFEANNGGDEYCKIVDDILRKDGLRINMTHKKAPTTASKLSRIIQFSPDIKRFYFIDRENRSKEYRAFMDELTLFVQTGKNAHDDTPDSLAMLVDFLSHGVKVVEVFRRVF